MTILLLLMGIGNSLTEEAREYEWRIGIRPEFATSLGEPANDIPGYSASLSYRILDDWWLTAEIWDGRFDFEKPAKHIFNQKGTKTADAVIDLTMISITGEYHLLEPGSIIDFYIGLGVGLAILGDDDAQELPTVDIEVEGSTGFMAHAVVGGALEMFDHVFLTLDISLGVIVAEMELTDRNTGQKESVSSFDMYGAALGIEVRF